jgi:hypothetical protein
MVWLVTLGESESPQIENINKMGKVKKGERKANGNLRESFPKW